jgi:hypothetical protein
MFEIVSWTHYEYCLSAVVKTELDNFVWRLVVLYGSPYEDKKMEFISELHLVMAGWQGPTLIGGGGIILLGPKITRVMVLLTFLMHLPLMSGSMSGALLKIRTLVGCLHGVTTITVPLW